MLTLRAGAALVICAALSVTLPSVHAQDTSGPLILVVDASAAMNQSIGGGRRIDIVRKALLEVVAEYPGNASLGMLIFGHRSTTDCGDIEIVEDLQSPLKDRRARLTSRLTSLTAQGRCSVSRTLLEALRMMRGKDGRVLVILGSTEDCRGDPCVVAETLRQSPVPMRTDVVALGIPAEQAPAVSCIGLRLGGEYIAVADADSARRAILSAVVDGLEGGRLRVSVNEAGKPKPSSPYVAVSQLGKPIAQLSDNPSVFQLPAGEYEVSARLGPHIESKRVGVKIRAGQIVDQALTISTGVLIVSVNRPLGKPLTPTPLVELIRGENYVATAKSLPARFETGVGTYGLRVTLNSRQQYVARGLTIEPARTVEKLVEVPAGQIQIFVSGRRFQGAMRPFVEVYQEDRFVASHSGSPADFQLLAGSYVARVREGGRALATKAFVVKAGGDLRVDLNVP
jgi:hypothetical protein